MNSMVENDESVEGSEINGESRKRGNLALSEVPRQHSRGESWYPPLLDGDLDVDPGERGGKSIA